MTGILRARAKHFGNRTRFIGVATASAQAMRLDMADVTRRHAGISQGGRMALAKATSRRAIRLRSATDDEPIPTTSP